MNRRAGGFTLIEMVVVLAVLAALAGMVIPLMAQTQDESAQTATKVNLARMREAIMGTPDKIGYVQDIGELPDTICDLFTQPAGVPAFNRNSKRGWRGPYISSAAATYAIDNGRRFFVDYGNNNDPGVNDSWSNPIVIQYPERIGVDFSEQQKMEYARLVSAGPDGIIDTPQEGSVYPLYPIVSERGDDIVVFLRRADVAP